MIHGEVAGIAAAVLKYAKDQRIDIYTIRVADLVDSYYEHQLSKKPAVEELLSTYFGHHT